MFCVIGTLNSVDTQTLAEWGGREIKPVSLYPLELQRTNLFPLPLNGPLLLKLLKYLNKIK